MGTWSPGIAFFYQELAAGTPSGQGQSRATVWPFLTAIWCLGLILCDRPMAEGGPGHEGVLEGLD